MSTLDINFVRSQFPAFSEPSLQGQAFFENAGGSYTCKPVLDRLTRYYTQRKVQPYGPYQTSRLAGDEMDEARSRMAAILGVETDDYCVLEPRETTRCPVGPRGTTRCCDRRAVAKRSRRHE